MPLTLKSPFAFLGRRRSGTEDERRSSSTSANPVVRKNSGSSSRRSGSMGPEPATLTGQATSGGSQSSRTPRGETLKVTVPENAKPGEVVRVRAPDGRLIEISLPQNCRPGQRITIEIDGFKQSGMSLNELAATIKSTFEVTRSSCASLRERLKEELELQRGLWASASVAQQAYGQRQAIGQDLMLMPAGPLEELSQTQALVFAAAEIGDGKQLLAALQEARQFSSVSFSLEECINSLITTEEAMLTYRCLLDAIHAQDRAEMEVWIEQARASNLQVPDATVALERLKRQESDSLQHFSNCKEVEQKLKFALEAGDTDLLKEVVAEADEIGLNSRVAVEAASRLKETQQRSRPSSASSPQKPSSPTSGGTSPATGTPHWRPAPRDHSSHRGTTSGSASKAKREESPPPLMPEFKVENPFEPKWREEARSQEPKWREEARSQEAGAAYAHSRPSASYSGTGEVPDGDKRSVRELIEECRRLGINHSGCTDRQDLLRVLVNHQHSKPQGPKIVPEKEFSGYESQPPPKPSTTGPTPRVHSSQSASPSEGPGFARSSIPASSPSGAFGTNQSSSWPRPPSAQQSGSRTVWDRRYPPPHLLTKRSKSLFLLGLDPYAHPSSAELRSAYRKAAMESHPDRQQNHSREAQAKELFQQVKEAFDHLNQSQ